VAFRQAACSTRVSISLRSIPKSIGLVKFGLPLLHHAMRRTLAGNGQAIELAGAAKSEISIISRTSPRPSEAILPASIITRRPSSSLAARNSSPKSRTSSSRRRRNQAPGLECVHCIIDNFANRGHVSVPDPGSFLKRTAIDAKVLQDRSGFLSEI
jgi:hypothetical protein